MCPGFGRVVSQGGPLMAINWKALNLSYRARCRGPILAVSVIGRPQVILPALQNWSKLLTTPPRGTEVTVVPHRHLVVTPRSYLLHRRD